MRLGVRMLLVLSVFGALIAFYRGDALAVGMIVGVSHKRAAAERPADVSDVVEVERAGARIRAWVLDPAGPPRGTVILLHGIRDSKASSLGSARAHVKRGFRAVAWDSRGHGESSGRFLTYGVEEARDLRALVDLLERRGLLVQPLAVVGTSYGAATAIQYAALDPRLQKLVAIAPFASLREVVPAYLRFGLGPLASLIPAAWVNYRIDEAARTAGFDPDQACSRCAAPLVRAPTLLVASRDDERIPFQQCLAIRDAFKTQVRLFPVSGARHVAVGKAQGVAEEVQRWLEP